jgi:hypothetical protein
MNNPEKKVKKRPYCVNANRVWCFSFRRSINSLIPSVKIITGMRRAATACATLAHRARRF